MRQPTGWGRPSGAPSETSGHQDGTRRDTGRLPEWETARSIGVELRGLQPLTPTLPVWPRPVRRCTRKSLPQVSAMSRTKWTPANLNRMKLSGHQNGTMQDKKRRVASRPPVFQLDLACSLWCARSYLRRLHVCPRSLSPTSGHLVPCTWLSAGGWRLGRCLRSVDSAAACGHEELEPVLVRLQGGKRAFGAVRRSPQWAWPQSSGHSRRRSPRPFHCRVSADAAGGERLIRFSVGVRRTRAAARTGRSARAR